MCEVHHMNLVTDPWIPVVWDNGCFSQVSLQTAFAECGRIVDFCVYPPERISLLNLFLAIAQQALKGPLDEFDHLNCREDYPATATRYLKRPEITKTFDLLGDHPRFLQIHGSGKPGTMALAKLGGVDESGTILFQPTLHNAAVFDPAWVALKLLAYQNYSPGGKVGGSAESGGKAAPVSGKAGPRRDSNAVHGYLRGANLKETIWLNMVPKSDLPASMPFGRPIWEILADLPKPEVPALQGTKELARSYLGRLVPLSRALWLDTGLASSEVTVGLEYPGFADGTRDASITTMRAMEKGKEVEVVLSCAKSGRILHVWRDLPAILQVHRMDKAGACLAPLPFRGLARFADSEFLDIWLGGVGGDQASSIGFHESNYRLPALALLNQDSNVLWRKRYERGVEFADKVKARLHGMVASWIMNARPSLANSNRKEFRRQLESMKTTAELAFWSILHAKHGILVEAANKCSLGATPVEDRDPWELACEEARLRAFNHACPGQTRLQARARSMALAGRRGDLQKE
jgi:CRISPR system Cascade subunit CasA